MSDETFLLEEQLVSLARTVRGLQERLGDLQRELAGLRDDLLYLRRYLEVPGRQ